MSIYTKIKHFLYKFKRNFSDIFFYPNFNGDTISYSNYWNSRSNKLNGFKINRANLLIDYIKSHSLNDASINILDIGSGLGDVQEYASKFLKNPITLSENTAEACSKLQARSFKVINLNVTDSNDYSVYNIVTCFEVLEHISMPEIFLKNFLKFDGKHLLFSVPNSGYWIYRLRFLFGRFPVQWKQHPGEHIRFWTYKDMKWWLNENKVSSYEIMLYDNLSVNKCIFPSLFYKGLFVIVRT